MVQSSKPRPFHEPTETRAQIRMATIMGIITRKMPHGIWRSWALLWPEALPETMTAVPRWIEDCRGWELRSAQKDETVLRLEDQDGLERWKSIKGRRM